MKTLEEQLDISFYERQGLSRRQIAKKLGCDPRTVKRYLEHPERINQPRRSVPRPSKLDPYREMIASYLQEDPEYRATTIYGRLCKQGFDGGYAIVQRAVKPLREQKQRLAYVRFETEPGAQAQVDFGEFQVNAPDGTVKKYYLFAMILGYSRQLYGELLERCDMVSFLEAHTRSFQAFGGVPQEVLYDRMKNVFLRQLAGKVEFTKSLLDLSAHYAFTPRVAPAYAAWVKGKIERPMDFVREGFWRGYAFTDLATANHDLFAWLDEKSERVHATTHERVDVRFRREQPHLTPLPPTACDVSERLWREVRKDCTIAVLGNRYVVEHTLVGHKVLVRVRGKQLRVFDDGRLVVRYTLPEGKGHLVQYPRFYEALRADRQMQARKFGNGSSRKAKGRAWAKTISPLKPPHPIDVSIPLAVEVERRPLSAYAPLCGEVAHA